MDLPVFGVALSSVTVLPETSFQSHLGSKPSSPPSFFLGRDEECIAVERSGLRLGIHTFQLRVGLGFEAFFLQVFAVGLGVNIDLLKVGVVVLSDLSGAMGNVDNARLDFGSPFARC